MKILVTGACGWTAESIIDALRQAGYEQEEIAKDFCDTYQMNAIAFRAGHIVDGKAGIDSSGQLLKSVNYAKGGWVCRYDLAKACILALDKPLIGYSAYHVIGSLSAKEYFDIDRTEGELGLIFDETFERYK